MKEDERGRGGEEAAGPVVVGWRYCTGIIDPSPKPATANRLDFDVAAPATANSQPARSALRADVVVRAAPFLLFISVLALASPLAQLLGQAGVDGRWSYVLRAVPAGLLMLMLWRYYGELVGSLARPAREWGLALATGVAVFVLWIACAALGWGFTVSSGFVALTADGGIDWPWAIVRVAGAALVVPLMEELFWRSFVARWIDTQDFLRLDPALLSSRALLVSSVIFGLEHDLWPAGIAAGLAYGLLYRSTGHLAAPILAHAVTNALLGAWVLHTRAWQLW